MSYISNQLGYLSQTPGTEDFKLKNTTKKLHFHVTGSVLKPQTEEPRSIALCFRRSLAVCGVAGSHPACALLHWCRGPDCIDWVQTIAEVKSWKSVRAVLWDTNKEMKGHFGATKLSFYLGWYKDLV